LRERISVCKGPELIWKPKLFCQADFLWVADRFFEARVMFAGKMTNLDEVYGKM